MNGHDPRLARVLLFNALGGAAAAPATVAALVLLDVGGVGGLVARSDAGALALLVLTALFAITFAGVQMAMAVMRLGAADTARGGRQLRIGAGEPRPIPIAAVARRRLPPPR